MLQVKVYNMGGEVVGTENLPAEVFGVQAKSTLVHQVVVAEAANARQTLAHTKTRANVQGGGKKPWKQKGTGRARQGSSRSPQWRGGGSVFGPRKERNYTQKINKKMKRLALLASLSDKVKADRLIVLDNLEVTAAKTKQLASMFTVLPMKGRKTLLVLSPKQPAVSRAARNVRGVGLTATQSLQVLEIVKYPYLLVTKQGLQEIAAAYGKKS